MAGEGRAQSGMGPAALSVPHQVVPPNGLTSLAGGSPVPRIFVDP